MKIDFIVKNYELKEKLKDLIEKKLQRLSKFFAKDVNLAKEVVIKVVLKKTGVLETMELTIIVDGVLMRSEVSTSNMFENIDVVLPKIEKQLIKHRKKITDRSQKLSIKELEQNFIPEIHDAESYKVVRSKEFKLMPLTVEDAVEQLELLDHSFYVFLNKETQKTSVIYRRKDGNYGLIETTTY